MTDLVERLEAWARKESASGIAEDAINEIERLRAEVLEQCRLNGMGGSREAKLIAENAQLRAEVKQQRLELGITEDACGMLESEIKQLRAEVADLREECAAYRGLQADQANARCELMEMLKLERARVAELLEEIEKLGEMGNVCTYHALKRVCTNCRCKRAPAMKGA